MKNSITHTAETIAHQGFRATTWPRTPFHALVRAAAWLKTCDARLYQIVFLAALLTIGVLARDFSLQWQQMALTFAAGLAAQTLWVRHLRLPHTGLLSALITCFGLSILLRADSWWVHPLVAVLAVSAKFTLRFNGKHLFNPANLGVILAITLLPGTWISPGQWGSDLAAALLFIALGSVVTQRARRVDTSWIFLATFLALAALRLWWIEVPPARIGTLVLHQLQNGALLLFAFFMLSDPMTTPNHPGARVFHAVAVALLAWAWQMLLYQPAGPVWALFLLVPLVPLLDHFFAGKRHTWQAVAPHAVTRAATPAVTHVPASIGQNRATPSGKIAA